MPVKQYKDFGKEAKDLATKNFPAAGTWKLEAKEKGGDRTPIISPAAEYKAGKGSVSFDLEYNLKEYKLKTKTNFHSSGVVKPKLTYDVKPGHKVEATLMGVTPDADFEITYEGDVSGAALYDKLTKKGGEAHVSYGFGPLTIGAGVAWAFDKGLSSWSLGARYADANVNAGLVTKDLRNHVLTFVAPIPNQPILLGTTVLCETGKINNADIVAEVAGWHDSKIRVKVDWNRNISLAYIRKFVNGWTAAIAMENWNFAKFGVQLTRE